MEGEGGQIAAEPGAGAIALPGTLLHEVFQHARECYPEEACGLLLGPSGARPVRIERCTNVQNNRKLSGQSDLDARHGYWIDEGELMRCLKRAEREGHEILVIYHSHVDTGAYFSATDAEQALGPDGRPLYPGVLQLVVGVDEHGVREAAGFTWSAEQSRFVGHAIREVRA